MKIGYRLGFPTGQDSATFRDSRTGKTFLSRDKGTKGQNFLHCPGTKGKRDMLKILPQDGTGQAGNAKIRDGRAGTVKIRDRMQDKTGQSRKGHFKTEKWWSKTENVVLNQKKEVLKQENDVQKQEIWLFFWISKIYFVPGRPGTEKFGPGHLLLPLSRDKGTAGQAKLFCSGTKGQRDRETFFSRD